MKFWPPWRWGKHDGPESPPDSLDQATAARRCAEERYRAVRDLTPEVAHISDTLRSIRRRNHLIDILEQSIQARDTGKEGPSHG